MAQLWAARRWVPLSRKWHHSLCCWRDQEHLHGQQARLGNPFHSSCQQYFEEKQNHVTKLHPASTGHQLADAAVWVCLTKMSPPSPPPGATQEKPPGPGAGVPAAQAESRHLDSALTFCLLASESEARNAMPKGQLPRVNYCSERGDWTRISKKVLTQQSGGQEVDRRRGAGRLARKRFLLMFYGHKTPPCASSQANRRKPEWPPSLDRAASKDFDRRTMYSFLQNILSGFNSPPFFSPLREVKLLVSKSGSFFLLDFFLFNSSSLHS